VLGADFTVPGNAWSNPATYVTNCGASLSSPNNPSTWKFNYVSGNGNGGASILPMPCGDTAIITDNNGDPGMSNGQVLQLKATVADWSNVPIDYAHDNPGLYWPAYKGQPGQSLTAWMPIERYTKIVLRITVAGYMQPGGNRGVYDWFYTGQYQSPYCDIDDAEILTPPAAPQFYTQMQCAPGGGTGIIYSPALDMTQYHTIESLATGDESTTLEQCIWYDGTFAGCNAKAVNYTNHDNSIVLTVNSNSQPLAPPGADIVFLIKSIDIWACPNYVNSGCAGTIVNHWPFP
jgi:hypothetical protein